MNLTKEPARTRNKVTPSETMSLDKALEKIESADAELLEIRKLRDAKLTSREVSLNDLKKESVEAISRWTFNPIVSGIAVTMVLTDFHFSAAGVIALIAGSSAWYAAGMVAMFKNNNNPLHVAKYLVGNKYKKYVEYEEFNQRMNVLVNEEYEKQKQAILKKSKKALKAANHGLKDQNSSITYSEEPCSEGFKIATHHPLSLSKWDALRYQAVLENGVEALASKAARKELTT